VQHQPGSTKLPTSAVQFHFKHSYLDSWISSADIGLLRQQWCHAGGVEAGRDVSCDVIVAKIGAREDFILAECEDAVVLEQGQGLSQGVKHKGGLDCGGIAGTAKTDHAVSACMYNRSAHLRGCSEDEA
jgi:hypothetical protein